MQAHLRPEAIAHAHQVIHGERALGLHFEPRLQRFVIAHPPLVTIANDLYLFEHWPLIAPIAVWLFGWRRDAYRRYRTMFLVAAAAGFFVFAVYPVAPPRFVAAANVGDMEHRFGEALVDVLQPEALLAPYAALPSMHLAWNVIIAVALVEQIRVRGVRYLPLLLPFGMAFAIVATGNHYVADAVTGAALGVAALLVSPRLRPPTAPRLRPPAAQRHRRTAQPASRAPLKTPDPPADDQGSDGPPDGVPRRSR